MTRCCAFSKPMGVLALLARHTPKDIAEERERFRQPPDEQHSVSMETRERTRDYVLELESRLASLPAEIEAGLAPEEIARMLGESLRQNFIYSGLPDTAQTLRATGAELAKAQQQLSNTLRTQSIHCFRLRFFSMIKAFAAISSARHCSSSRPVWKRCAFDDSNSISSKLKGAESRCWSINS